MLDVHPPHTRMEGFKDFLLHLLTITIGLLIALSLEGCVERRHHRELVREAEDGLHAEIAKNAQTLDTLRQQIKDQQKQLDDDLKVLSQMRTQKAGKHPEIGFTFAMHSFDTVTWRTAQTTGAVAYMPYSDARTYSDIYEAQDELYKVEGQVVEDVMHSASFVSTQPESWKPTPAQVDEIVERVGLLRLRLNLLTSIVDSLNEVYGKYLRVHG